MNLIGKFLAWPVVANWLIARAKRTPYSHLHGYMNRYWLFNPYENANGAAVTRNWILRHLPSIRVHQILRADDSRDMHDHPWNARSVILRGWYIEERELDAPCFRETGSTATLRYNEFHRIDAISHPSVWTLFITWKRRGAWGFKVNGQKVDRRDYIVRGRQQS